jgi:hypothetical protein
MYEIDAWVEDRRAANNAAFHQFLKEQKQIWTPPREMYKCCVKWLADGPLKEDYGYGDFDEYSFRNGCDGRCGRDHPKITLSFDAKRKVVLATLSHQLDPFCKIFLQRCAEETAWPQSAISYELDGFLPSGLEAIPSH